MSKTHVSTPHDSTNRNLYKIKRDINNQAIDKTAHAPTLSVIRDIRFHTSVIC